MTNKLRNYILAFLFFPFAGFCQQGVTTFGLQYKPIIPNRFIGTYEQDFNKDQFESSIKQKLGHSYGMVVRVGLTKNVSLETGINYTQRRYDLFFSVPDSSLEAQNDLGVVSYEIPVLGLIYIRLGEDFYMNTSLGVAMTLFPSDVRVTEPIPTRIGELFKQEGAYRSKLQGAVLANLGFEYRTKKSGFFYLGTSYHLPFTPIMTFAMAYEYQGGKVVKIDNVLGSYLTLDFRYFFHEKPNKNNR